MRGRLNYANVMATLALFVALGGIAYAQGAFPGIPNNAILGRMIANQAISSNHIANQSLKSLDLKNKSVAGQDLANQTLTAQQIKPETLVGDLLQAKTLGARVIQNGALTGEEVANGSLTGDDVVGSTVSGVNAESVDGRSLNCPAGTTFYVWGCWELSTNAAANWTGAAVGCGIKGGILPGAAELAAFADQTPGVVITTPEWTSEMSDGGAADALQGIKFNEPTVVNYAPFAQLNPFRCVLPIIN